jgi:periplasmic divalent cation tolerance protein
MQFIDVLVTCPDRAVADAIGRACVEERLAACANIGGEVCSIYRWRGAVEEASEIQLLLKTRESLFDALAERIRALHPYETPCIIATEIVAIDAAYAAWLDAETA